MGKKKNEDSYEYYQIISNDGLKDTPKKKESIYNKIPETDKAPKVKPENAMKLYHFKGSVLYFDKIVIGIFDKKTMAVSEAQAINNLTFRAKKDLKLEANAGGVKLVGSIKIEEQ